MGKCGRVWVPWVGLLNIGLHFPLFTIAYPRLPESFLEFSCLWFPPLQRSPGIKRNVLMHLDFDWILGIPSQMSRFLWSALSTLWYTEAIFLATNLFLIGTNLIRLKSISHKHLPLGSKLQPWEWGSSFHPGCLVIPSPISIFFLSSIDLHRIYSWCVLKIIVFTSVRPHPSSLDSSQSG